LGEIVVRLNSGLSGVDQPDLRIEIGVDDAYEKND
jgi:hypothetical protein